MPRRSEWAVRKDGEVMLVVSPPYDHAPVQGGAGGRNRYVVVTESGESHALVPNPKVASKLKRCEQVLLVEMTEDDLVLRTTPLPTGNAAPCVPAPR